MINIFKNKYYRAVVLYKMAIFIGFFIIFVSMTTVIAINRVQLARCHVGLKQALSILSQALVFANFDSNNEKRPDIYYYYLVDAFNTHFESTNCAHSKELACHIGEYYTMNNKAKMSSLIFRKGAKISINNKIDLIFCLYYVYNMHKCIQMQNIKSKIKLCIIKLLLKAIASSKILWLSFEKLFLIFLQMKH